MFSMLSKNLFLADTGTFCYKQEQLVLTFISQKNTKGSQNILEMSLWKWIRNLFNELCVFSLSKIFEKAKLHLIYRSGSVKIGHFRFLKNWISHAFLHMKNNIYNFVINQNTFSSNAKTIHTFRTLKILNKLQKIVADL